MLHHGHFYRSVKWNIHFQNSPLLFFLDLYGSLHCEKYHKPVFHPFPLTVIREQPQDLHQMIFERNIGYKQHYY